MAHLRLPDKVITVERLMVVRLTMAQAAAVEQVGLVATGVELLVVMAGTAQLQPFQDHLQHTLVAAVVGLFLEEPQVLEVLEAVVMVRLMVEQPQSLEMQAQAVVVEAVEQQVRPSLLKRQVQAVQA